MLRTIKPCNYFENPYFAKTNINFKGNRKSEPNAVNRATKA